MRVCLEAPFSSYAIERVIFNLKKYAPSQIEIVKNKPDLTILHVIGRQDSIYKESKKSRYCVIQYCLKSTMRPSVSSWIDLWKKAELVWSYYNLPSLCKEIFNFYHSPLGVDSNIFRLDKLERPYLILTSGQSYLTESVREVYLAAKKLNREIVHLGPKLRVKDVLCFSGLPDWDLNRIYNQCEFVSGLRRKEGFELPAAEGLLCGARPILFDQPHYRQWYNDWGIFIPETPRQEVIDNLEPIFREGSKPICEKERNLASKLFDWKTIIEGFWKRVT